MSQTFASRAITLAKCLAAVALTALVTACGPSAGKYDTAISLDPALTSGPVPTIAVNVIALNDTDAATWSTTSMSKYWAPDSQMRKDSAGMVKEFVFGPGKTEPQMLSKSDPIWEKWFERKPTQLFILANLPGAHEDLPGGADNRRIILPLMNDRWESGQKISIVVQRGKLRNDTPPKAPK